MQHLQLVLAFILFVISATLGAMLYQEYNTKIIICPEGRLIQAMSDGREVLCIYSKEPMKEKQRTYKKGELKENEVRLPLHLPYGMQNR